MQTCECGVICKSKFNLERHLQTRSHELNMLCGESLVSSENGIYECEICNYSSVKKDHFRKHILSAKHVAAREENHHAVLAQEAEEVEPVAATASVPVVSNAVTLENEFVKPVMLVEIMEMFLNHLKEKDSQQIQQTEIFKTLADRIMAHQAQQSTNNITNNGQSTNNNTTNNDNSNNDHSNTTNNNTTNNNNNTTNNTTTNKKKFNLNFFLNEECKNAMNLNEFIQGLVVSMEDLEHFCEVGYTEGMSKIITKAINGKHKTERPIHCSDSKRETMYVKTDNVWQKDSNKEECQRLIDHITSKNYKFMKKWCDENPGFTVSDSPEYDKWYSITRQLCNTDPKAKKKLMRHLALTTEIEKDLNAEMM